MTDQLFSADAEKAVLGSILIDPDALERVADILTPTDFFVEVNQGAFAAMLNLQAAGEPIDELLLCAELVQGAEFPDFTWNTYILGLTTYSPTSINVEHYAGIVKDFAKRRVLVAAATAAIQSAYDGKPLDTITTSLRDGLDDTPVETEIADASTLVKAELVAFEEDVTAHESGTSNLLYTGHMIDLVLGGMRPGQLVVLAGRPSIGKTTAGCNVVRWLMERNVPCGIISLEMDPIEVVQKFISPYSIIDLSRLRSHRLVEDEIGSYMDAVNKVANLPLYVSESTKIRNALRDMAKLGVKFVMIDYLQLLEGDRRNENRTQELSRITRNLKLWARKFKIVILALSQLNRAIENRTEKRPLLSDLRESGSIEQDADVVIALNRDDYYNQESESQNIIEWIFLKNRGGGNGSVSMFFRKELGDMRDLDIQRVELPENVYGG